MTRGARAVRGTVWVAGQPETDGEELVIRSPYDAHARLGVGGVIMGDVPNSRADQMPEGGVTGSGTGREGLRCAMDDYTEPRVLVLTGLIL